MPQGGGSTFESQNQPNSNNAGKQIFRLVREGVSWSGYEGNSCFLSTGASGRFIDISKASGFAFPDDGRAMILTDWDGDGDLDSFISNRNAPQVRFLRNDIPMKGRDWLSIKLKGSGTINSDAIGARVKLIMNDQPPISRTLRAGDGFQAQASKRLHFGLGSNNSIKCAEVRWPNGETKVYTGLEANQHYTINYSQNEIESYTKKPTSWPTPLPTLELKKASNTGFAALRSDLLAPSINYTGFNDVQQTVEPAEEPKPILLNLWASWCEGCRAELDDFKTNRKSIEDSGIKVLALSVDEPDQYQAALEFNTELSPYFETGIASKDLLTKIRILHDTFFEKRGDLILPTSVLINAEGKVIGFYEGKVTTKELIQALDDSSEENARWNSLPFDGRWLAEPLEFLYSEYGNKLLDYNFINDAVKLHESHQWIETGRGVERFLVRLAQSLENKGNTKQSLSYFTEVANLRADNAQIQAELAGKYGDAGDYVNAANYYQRAVSIDASDNGSRYNLGIMLNRIGRQEQARAEFQKVILKEPRHTMALANLASYYIKLSKPHEAIGYLEKVLETKPDFHPARFQLGRLHEAVGDKEAAITEYLMLLKLDPNNQAATDRLKLLNKGSK